MYKPLFELQEQLVEITHLNVRKDKRNNDEILAADLKLLVSLPNTALAMFAPTLRHSLYHRLETLQDELIDTDHLPDLRYPLLEPLKWAGKFEHALVTIHSYVRPEDDIEFNAAKLNKFKITPQQGGTVSIELRLQVNPTEKDSAKLMALLGSSVHFSIKIEEPAEQAEESLPFHTGERPFSH